MNRRRFLKRAGLWVPGAIAFPAIVRAQLGDPAFVSALTQPKSGFSYYAAAFDGTNDYLTMSGSPLAADGKTGLVSFWLKLNASSSDTDYYYFFSSDISNTLYFRLYRDNAGRMVLYGMNVSQVSSLWMYTDTNTLVKSMGWVHILASWDLAQSGKGFIYINDTQSQIRQEFDNDTIIYTGFTAFQIGTAYNSHTFKLYGSMCEFWLNTEYLDISVEANRRKFRTAGGKPADLGANGSTPTGNQPRIYLKNQVPSWQNNAGLGGNFTVGGSLDDDPAIP